MDWNPSEMQQAIAELAPQILSDSDPWTALRDAELLGLETLPEICSLLISVGEAGATAPALPTLVLGAPLAQFGTAAPAGTCLTGALLESQSRDPRHASTEARDGLLYGTKICVPAVDRAEIVIVPTRDGVYAVELSSCEVVLQHGTNDDPLGIVTFDGTPGVRLGGKEVLDWWIPRVHVGLCALQLGLSRAALSMTARYTAERTQFGAPIGSFQAVRHRAADAWIDTQAMEVTLWQAAWRVEQGLPAEREISIARYWASEGSHRVLAAAQHLHGGMGFDRDYPLHRYYLTSKQWEFTLGGASAQLDQLGELLAR
jgi:3-oxocholest-4-en-26-oyl-CoA dehydrogenase beta subunit